MTRKAKLLFHSPCFDGIASAVLARDFLTTQAQWGDVEVAHVNYDVRETWLSKSLPDRTAVVDFLYHPDAAFWADHHASAFLNDDVRLDFAGRDDDWVMYDRGADSCAGLLWRHFDHRFTYRNDQFAELVRWAEKIDAARYESVDEAFSFAHPALRISASLAFAENGYSELLVSRLAQCSLEDVSELPDVQERFLRFRESTAEGLTRLKASAKLRSGIVVFDVDARNVIVPRYGPYRLFPDALYSVGLVRYQDGAKITAMRNPWIDFESVPLGEIFTRYGGGGHQRVASALVPPNVDPGSRFEAIVAAVASAGGLASP